MGGIAKHILAVGIQDISRENHKNNMRGVVTRKEMGCGECRPRSVSESIATKLSKEGN